MGPDVTATVTALRRFSRFYTRQLGLLDEGLLASGFSLTEVRVLYELAQRDGVAAVDLTRELALDSGYLSRILRRFAAQGLVRREAHAGDARRGVLTLTAQGRKTLALLDKASSTQAAKLVAHLDDAGRAELTEALARVERALAPPAAARAAPAPIVLRAHEAGDMGWVVEREGTLYAREFGYDASFEALVAEIVARFLRRFDPKHERCWIAEQGGRRMGAVFVVRKSARVAQLRLLHVERSARGQGLGGRLVDECIRFARERGYLTLALWTQSHLDAARHLYQSRGFVLKDEEKHRSFGKSLVAQTWTLQL